MTLHHPMCPPPRGLRLVSSRSIAPPPAAPIGASEERQRRAAAAASLSRLTSRVIPILQLIGNADHLAAAEHATEHFEAAACGERDGEDATLPLFLLLPDLADFVLRGDLDALICAAAFAGARH